MTAGGYRLVVAATAERSPARRGAYRVLHAIDDDSGPVTVLRIDHRSDAYRKR